MTQIRRLLPSLNPFAGPMAGVLLALGLERAAMLPVNAAPVGAVGAWGGIGPVPMAAQSGVAAITAGWAHTAVLKNDGSVVAWGNNNFGQATVPVTAQGEVIAIAAGIYHTVALKSGGSVVVWGDSGQTNVPVAAQSGVAAIAAGGYHTLALMTDGSVVAWGWNGQVQTDVPVAAKSGIKAIAAGGHYSMALKNDGAVVEWGGIGPVPVAAQSGVTAIAAGGDHAVVLRRDGSVVAWGDNLYGQTNVPSEAMSGVVAIAAGGYHTVALKTDGSVVAWGDNQVGQTTVPVAAQGRVTAIAAGGLYTVVLVTPIAPAITTQPASQSVEFGQSASFTVTASGYPLYYQWSQDGVEIVGAADATYRLSFAQANGTVRYTVAVSNPAGSVTSAPPAELTVNPAAPGAVVAWGDNSQGQVTGTPTDEPGTAGSVTLGGRILSGVTAIAVGHRYTVALRNDGSVSAWGLNNFGQVTGTPTDEPAIASPVTLEGQALSGVTEIATGQTYTVALRSDGSVVAWGNNGHGQVTGIPTDEPAIANPVTLGGQALSGVTAIVADQTHTLALRSDGSVVAWGDNRSGQVTGAAALDEPESAIANPVTLEGRVLSGVTAIAAGSRSEFWKRDISHTVALKNDGTVVAWGDNSYGQVTGTAPLDEPYSAIANPVTLGGHVLCGVSAIAVGPDYTLALKNDGSIVAWGNNSQGQVTGTPATDSPNGSGIANPVTLGGQALSGVTAIAAGSHHTVALKNDGSLVAWGWNDGGQVTGIPPVGETLSGVANPVMLGDQPLMGVTAIATAWTDTVALKSDGSVVAWGFNENGQTSGSPPADGTYTVVASSIMLGGQVLSGVTAIAAGGYHTVAILGTAPPYLRFVPGPASAALSWSASGTGYAVQAADRLDSVSWQPAHGTPVQANGLNFLTVDPTTTPQYFRLVKP